MEEKIERPVGGDDEALELGSLWIEPSRDTEATDETQVDVTKYSDWLRDHIRRRYPHADREELFQVFMVAMLEAKSTYDPSRGTFRYYLEHFAFRSAFQEYLRNVGAVKRPIDKPGGARVIADRDIDAPRFEGDEEGHQKYQ
jgi:hypothetical protein